VWVAAVAAVVAVAVPAIWGPIWLGLPLFSAVACASLLPGWVGAGSAVGLGGATVVVGVGVGAPGGEVLSVGLVVAVGGVAVSGIMRLVATGQALREAKAEVAALAAEGERLRLSRDLHDAVKQQLFVATMELGATRANLQAHPPQAADHLHRVEEAIAEARSELAALIGDMRPPATDPADLTATLRGLLDAWSNRFGIPAHLTGDDAVAGDEAVFRAVREALANVARHSQAARVEVTVHHDRETVRVEVADDGCGFTPERTTGGHGGHGLAIMREHLADVGGAVAVHSAPGAGTTVVLTWPSERGAADE
jgi:NarL family two-component system sensor histidine kinase LiaS